MPTPRRRSRVPSPRGLRTPLVRFAAAGLLGAGAALIVACGSAGNGLIPIGNAGPLQRDFEEVAQAAQAGNGSCSSTEAALLKTERDFDTLPATVVLSLRTRLHEGIANLSSRAKTLCSEPLTPATVTSTAPRTTTTPTTSTPAQTTPAQTAPTTPTTPTTASPGGGTPAPGAGESPSGNGQGDGAGEAPNGGAGGAGAGAGAPEAGK